MKYHKKIRKIIYNNKIKIIKIYLIIIIFINNNLLINKEKWQKNLKIKKNTGMIKYKVFKKNLTNKFIIIDFYLQKINN